MSDQKVKLNGAVYDQRTGQPVRLERDRHNTHASGAHVVHRTTQKSRTLHRKYVRKDEVSTRTISDIKAPARPQHAISKRKSAPAPKAVDRSESISRFHGQPAAKPVEQKVAAKPIEKPAPHATLERAHQQLAKPAAKPALKSAQDIKQEAIAKAMAATPAKSARKEVKPKRRVTKAKKRLQIASAGMAILILGAYFTYLSMPNISTRVAAAQAGIDATYPNYRPTGYSLHGPVAFQEGRVTMKFAANAGPASFTLDQSKSGWDSSAILEIYVKPKVHDDYNITTANGLTIYTYGNNAAWVNRGILYTINGDAPLSNEQIQNIATSL